MLLGTALACACSGPSEFTPAAPSPVVGPLTGVWHGTLTRSGNRQTVRMELTEVWFGGFLSDGTYTASDNTGTTTGTAGGVTHGADVALLLTPVPPLPCAVVQPYPVGQFILNLKLSGNSMTGDGAVGLCGNSVGVTATFTKQTP